MMRNQIAVTAGPVAIVAMNSAGLAVPVARIDRCLTADTEMAPEIEQRYKLSAAT